MTTNSYKRCQHCGSEYVYQGSGHGCNRPLNDSTWCPDCKQAINKALAARPRLFEMRYRLIAEIPFYEGITRQDVLDWEARETSSAQFKAMPVRQIFPGLYDMTTGDTMSIRMVRGYGKYDGHRFQVATWGHKPEYEIKVAHEWDLTKQGYTGHRWP